MKEYGLIPIKAYVHRDRKVSNTITNQSTT